MQICMKTKAKQLFFPLCSSKSLRPMLVPKKQRLLLHEGKTKLALAPRPGHRKMPGLPLQRLWRQLKQLRKEVAMRKAMWWVNVFVWLKSLFRNSSSQCKVVSYSNRFVSANCFAFNTFPYLLKWVVRNTNSITCFISQLPRSWWIFRFGWTWRSIISQLPRGCWTNTVSTHPRSTLSPKNSSLVSKKMLTHINLWKKVSESQD